MSHTINGSDHLQEPALGYARQDFPIIRDSVTVGEALNIIRREGLESASSTRFCSRERRF